MYFNKNFRSWTNMTGCGHETFKNNDLYARKRDTAYFDSRAFNLAKEEVNNYFVWRQQDCIRNSIEALGRSKFSHRQLEGVNGAGVKSMLKEVHGIDWHETPMAQQRGVCAYRVSPLLLVATIPPKDIYGKKEWILDEDIPLFNEDVNYIEKHLE
jgi:tRNA(His) 5'-end guanylyltransferase